MSKKFTQWNEVKINIEAKMYDVKRLEKKIGMISKEDFQNLKKKFGELIDV